MDQVEDRIPIYRNPDKAVEVRVKDLLSRMELKEKIGQITQIERRVANQQIIRDLCIGISFSRALALNS